MISLRKAFFKKKQKNLFSIIQKSLSFENILFWSTQFQFGVNPFAGKFENLRRVKKLVSSITMAHVKAPDKVIKRGKYTPIYVEKVEKVVYIYVLKYDFISEKKCVVPFAKPQIVFASASAVSQRLEFRSS